MITPLKNPLEHFPIFSSLIISDFTISDRIKNLAISIFKLSTSLYLGVFGTCELVQKNMQADPQKVNGTSKTTLQKVQSSSYAYLCIHGGLMTGSGVFGLLEALESFGVTSFGLTSVGNVANGLGAAGNILFLGANIIALAENMRLYNDIKETDWTKTNIVEGELIWIEQSVMWGIVSNLGYIVATASLIYHGMTALVLVVAALSCFAGGIKILYDLALWAKEKGLTSGTI